MRKFIVSIRMDDNGKKITAIKEIRGAMGIGLTEAKALVENCQGWMARKDYLVNSYQLANLVVLTHGALDGGLDHPQLTILDVRPAPLNSVTDFSEMRPV